MILAGVVLSSAGEKVSNLLKRLPFIATIIGDNMFQIRGASPRCETVHVDKLQYGRGQAFNDLPFFIVYPMDD